MRYTSLLFAGMLVVATLQPASAQLDNANQDVTIDVQSINSISVNGAPSITISSLNEWVEQDAGESTHYLTVGTNNGNASRSVEATINSGDTGGLWLRVSVSDSDNNGNLQDKGQDDALIIDEGSSQTVTVISSFSSIADSERANLVYEAKASADASQTMRTIEVKYTLVAGS